MQHSYWIDPSQILDATNNPSRDPSMEKQRILASTSMLRDRGTPPRGPNCDQDVVKMAEVILRHFPDLSSEAAYALLMSARKRKT
jgi:hypothetical protein